MDRENAASNDTEFPPWAVVYAPRSQKRPKSKPPRLQESFEIYTREYANFGSRLRFRGVLVKLSSIFQL
eukprot:scaffold8179_cov126-Skeletonema_marinoi.AAC.5